MWHTSNFAPRLKVVSVLLFLVLALRAVPSVDRSIVKKKEVSVKIKLTVQHFFGIGIERFRMTSRRPYWCPKQWNGGRVGVPNQSSGSWTLFLCKRFLLFQDICTDAGHVSENTLYIVFLLKQVTISIIFPGFPNLLGKLKNGRGRGKENPNP